MRVLVLMVWIAGGWHAAWSDAPSPDPTPQDLLTQAQALLEQDAWNQARDIAERGLEEARASSAQPGLEGAFLIILGRVYRQEGALDEALDALNQASKLMAKQATSDSPLRGRLAHELGACSAMQGDRDRAEAFLGQALEIRERILGPDSPEVAETLEALAKLDMLRGNMESARRFATRALEIYEKQSGPELADSIRAAVLLARCLSLSGDLDAAQREYEEVLETMTRIYGKEYLGAADVYRGLGSIFLQKGVPDRAVLAFQAALYLEDHHFGKQDARRVRTLLQLAEALMADDKSMQAEEVLREAKTLAMQQFPEDDVRLAFAWYGLGHVYTLWRNDAEAANAFDSALSIFERHPREMGDMIRKSLIEVYRARVRLNQTDELDEIEKKLTLFGVTQEERKEPASRKRPPIEFPAGN